MTYAVLFAAQFAIGSAAILGRIGLASGLTPGWLSAWRLSIAAAAVCVAAAAFGRNEVRPPIGTVARLAFAGACLGIHFAAWFASLEHISVARSTLLVATTPLWSGLLERYALRRPPSGQFWAGVVVAAAGLCMVVAASARFALPSAVQPSVGDALALLGAVALSVYMFLTQPLQNALGTSHVIGWTYSSAALFLLPLALIFEGPAPAIPANGIAWAVVAGMAAGPQLLGHTALNWSLKRLSSSVVGASTLTEPVFAAALAWWLLGEPLSFIQIAGGALVLTGVWISLRSSPGVLLASSEP